MYQRHEIYFLYQISCHGMLSVVQYLEPEPSVHQDIRISLLAIPFKQRFRAKMSTVQAFIKAN